jgi:hypothetical protein
MNFKYTPAQPVSFIWYEPERLYSWGDLLSAAADLVTEVAAQRAQRQQAFEHSGGGRGATILIGEDAELLQKALTWKTGAKLARLWRGDTSDYQGDESRADQGLAALLVFATGHDAARVDRMMRASGLMRQKWDRPGYLEETIMRALYSCHASYSPPNADRLGAIAAAQPTVAVEGGAR